MGRLCGSDRGLSHGFGRRGIARRVEIGGHGLRGLFRLGHVEIAGQG